MNQQYGLGTSGEAAADAALAARSEGMNQQYGLGTSGEAAADAALAARSEGMNQQYALGTSGEAAADAALVARSEGMNQQYGLGGEATDGGLTLEAPAPADALLIGGLLLTIAGATFAVKRTAGGRLA